MKKDISFIEDERKLWGKYYTDIAFAISEISPFIDEKDLKNRKYYSKFGIMKEYIKLLDDAELDSNKKSFFNMFKSDDRIDKLKAYKNQNRAIFKQFEKCSKCACLNCVAECDFLSCGGCREGSYIKSCDKEKINVRYHSHFNVDLKNNDTGARNRYKVLATLEDCEIENLYIILQNVANSDDKLVLYYTPGIKEDTFGEITDVDEFDYVVEVFQQADY
ncbi:MAG: DUF1292 domain-containing protein [Clostridium sp.]